MWLCSRTRTTAAPRRSGHGLARTRPERPKPRRPAAARQPALHAAPQPILHATIFGFPPKPWRVPLCCLRLDGSDLLVLDRRQQPGGAMATAGVVEVVAPGHHNLSC